MTPTQHKLHTQLEERLSFETLLTNLSARFVNVPAEQVDAEILDAQRRICDCLGLEASALWQNQVENSNVHVLTHLFRPSGGPPAPDRMDAQEYFPWCRQQLLAGNMIIVSSLEKLPPEAARDVESWKYFGAKTSLTFPLSAGGGPIFGFLSFNDLRTERVWPKAIVKRLQLVAQIFANALARKQLDQTLRASEELSRTTFEQAAVGISHVGTDGRWLRVNDKLCAILGYPREELMQLTFQDITYPEDLDKDLNYVRQLLSGEINTYSIDKRYIRKDRSLVWANLTVSLVRSDAGEPKHFISVVEDITRRKQAEVELHELSGRLIKAQEKERAWLAKELHDGLSQNLALLAIELDQLAQHPPDNPAQVSVRMEAVSARVKELAEDVHHLSHGLHPSILEHVGLTAALKGFCRELEHSRSVTVHFTARDVPNMLPKEVALCLYRVAQEALQNVAKHSGAKQATVEVRVAGDEIHMRIADDGKGFDLLSETTTDSIGLVGMRERIGLVHGEIRWDTKPGQGTTVDVRVPLQAKRHRSLRPLKSSA